MICGRAHVRTACQNGFVRIPNRRYDLSASLLTDDEMHLPICLPAQSSIRFTDCRQMSRILDIVTEDEKLGPMIR